jgi:transcriptional regulator with XRE-family HTH domain
MAASGATLEFVRARDRGAISQKKIGKQIRMQRHNLGWTQRELAEKVHTSQNHIYQLENGRTDATVSTLQKLADALEVTIQIEPMTA